MCILDNDRISLYECHVPSYDFNIILVHSHNATLIKDDLLELEHYEGNGHSLHTFWHVEKHDGFFLKKWVSLYTHINYNDTSRPSEAVRLVRP